ncbi:hypothetical protein V7S43_008118 [Phytophthora oleae]|uniref:HMG box domain-containing protein n=1 Tax=Phytophthora oleae TaxID=2107226 RepID=A0ABD3FK99_9STRA
MDAAARKSRDREPVVPDKNAYQHFSRGRREGLSAAHPSWSVQQVSSELGRQWQALTTADRKPWVELALFDKARFHTEAYQYECQQQTDEQSVKRFSKRKKHPNEPRQPDTAYICFWKSRRSDVVAANPSLDAQHVSKEMSRQWRAMPDSERQLWVDMAAKDKLRFQEEIARFQPTLSATSELPPAPLKDPFAPKPAKTGFQLFMSRNRESFTLLDMTISEFRTEMSQLWKRLSDADKNEWYELAKQDEQRFKREMNSYKPPAYMDSEVQRVHKRIDELKRLTRGDPTAPRLPQNAYNAYLATARQEMAVLHPDRKNPQIMREIGIAWKTLSDDERVVYQRKAEADVDRFRKEMEDHLARQQENQYIPDHPVKKRARKRKEQYQQQQEEKELQDKEKQSRQDQQQPVAVVPKQVKAPVRKKRKTGPPRRPKTAYNLMYMSKRTELLAAYQMSHNECSSLCGRLWRQMPEEEREPYKRMAAEDKRRYEVELEMYYNSRSSVAKDKMLNDSVGFRFFLGAKRREKDISLDEAAAIWRDMSEPHQLLWTEHAKDNRSVGASVNKAEAEGQQQLEEGACVMPDAPERSDFSPDLNNVAVVFQ